MWLHEWKPVLNHATFFTVIKKTTRSSMLQAPTSVSSRKKGKEIVSLT